MINITMVRNNRGFIESYTMSGHALFAEHGQDIVCAGASAVSVGMINAIYELTGVAPDIRQDDGFLSCQFPIDLSETIQDKVQLLLEGMVISLQSIEEQYEDHIKITFKE